MLIPHRPPTEEELTTLPRFELTSKALWSPDMYYDDQATSTTYDTESFVPANETHSYHVHNIPRCPTLYVIHRSDDTNIARSNLTDMPQIYDFDISIFPEFATIQAESVTVETVFDKTDDSELPMWQVDTAMVGQPKVGLLRIENYTHNDSPQNLSIEPATNKKIPKEKKVLTSLTPYQTALKVLNLFRDSPGDQEVFEDFKAIYTEMDWINFPLQDIDAGDIPLYQHFRIALAHVLPEQTE
jgi:hypothetical protein